MHGMEGQRQCQQAAHQDGHRHRCAPQRRLAPLRQRRRLAQVFPALPNGLEQGVPSHQQGQYNSHEEILSRNEPSQPQHHEQAVQRCHCPIKQQPGSLPLAAERRLGVACTAEPAVEQPSPVLGRALRQVRQLDQVAEHVVAVVAHQRVAVDHQGGETGNQHHVVGHRAEQATFHRQPDIQRHGAQEKFCSDACPGHRRPCPFGREGMGGTGVHIGHRREHHQHQAHLPHGTAPVPHRQAMGQLMYRLDRRIHRPEQQQVAGGQHPVGQVLAQGRPVLPGQRQGRQQHRQPHQQRPRPEQPPRPAGLALEPAVRVEQRQLQTHRIEQGLLQALAALAGVPLEHFTGIRCHLGLQQILGMQLRQKLHQFRLAQRQRQGPLPRLLLRLLHGLLPDLVQRTAPVHQHQHLPQ